MSEQLSGQATLLGTLVILITGGVAPGPGVEPGKVQLLGLPHQLVTRVPQPHLVALPRLHNQLFLFSYRQNSDILGLGSLFLDS